MLFGVSSFFSIRLRAINLLYVYPPTLEQIRNSSFSLVVSCGAPLLSQFHVRRKRIKEIDAQRWREREGGGVDSELKTWRKSEG